MQTVKLILPQPHSNQNSILSDATRFVVEDCGRRFGKTLLDVLETAKPSLDGQPVGIFFPSYKMLSPTWRDFKAVFAPVTSKKDEQEHRLELVTGSVIDMWSLDNADRARGRKYKRVIIDEASVIPDLIDIWENIIRATLIDLKGDARIKGTPKGRNGFWQMYQWGIANKDGEWKSFHFTSYDNPHLPVDELDKLRLSLPERVFQQEIMGAFLDDAGGVFRRVMDAATAQGGKVDGHSYVMGVDWGKSNDFTVLTIIDTNTSELAELDRFNQIDYQFQLQRLTALYEKYKPVKIIAEKNSMGDPLIEQLQRAGLPVTAFNTTSASKTEAIESLSLAFEQMKLKILPDPVLISELQSYEMERTPSGAMKYGAPSGMHDDCVMSLALAWNGAKQPQLSLIDNPFDW